MRKGYPSVTENGNEFWLIDYQTPLGSEVKRLFIVTVKRTCLFKLKKKLNLKMSVTLTEPFSSCSMFCVMG